LQKAIGHFAAGDRQARRFPREEFFEEAIAARRLRSTGEKSSWSAYGQQMRGSGSPTSISITRVPP
jgi:hypothetical protein